MEIKRKSGADKIKERKRKLSGKSS